MTVATMLHDARLAKGWSIAELARRAKVDRAFLTNILQGDPPPRVRNGHKTAEHDERYRHLAEKLGLEVAPFLAQVKAEQIGADEAVPGWYSLAQLAAGQSTLLTRWQKTVDENPSFEDDEPAVAALIVKMFDMARKPELFRERAMAAVDFNFNVSGAHDGLHRVSGGSNEPHGVAGEPHGVAGEPHGVAGRSANSARTKALRQVARMAGTLDEFGDDFKTQLQQLFYAASKGFAIGAPSWDGRDAAATPIAGARKSPKNPPAPRRRSRSAPRGRVPRSA